MAFQPLLEHAVSESVVLKPVTHMRLRQMNHVIGICISHGTRLRFDCIAQGICSFLLHKMYTAKMMPI